MKSLTLLRGGTSALTLAVLFSVMPLQIPVLGIDDGFTVATAFAKDRDDDRGGKSGRSGKSSRSSDDDDDRGRGRGRGRGGDDDDDGHDDDRRSSSGRGSDDDHDDDDHRGRGRSGDDDHDDDHRGRGRGGDDDDRRLQGGTVGGTAIVGGAGGGSESDRLRVVKVEQTASGIEIVYSNGVKEEFENGRYELKNQAGRTVAERNATQADVARLRGNLRNSGYAAPTSVAFTNGGSEARPRASSGGLPPSSRARRIEIVGDDIEVRYGNGWKEEIEGGRYELKDPNNNTVVQRPATHEDSARLTGLAGR